MIESRAYVKKSHSETLLKQHCSITLTIALVPKSEYYQKFANFMRLLKVKQPTVSSLSICSLLGFTMRNYASFLQHYGLQADVKWHLSYSDSEAERKKEKKFHYCVQI